MNTRPTTQQPLQRRAYRSKKKINRKKINKPFIIKFILYTLFFFTLFTVIFIVVLYQKYIADLPSVKDLQNIEISQSSTIYDKDGGELYNIYKEKRTYVDFEDINKNMINAIVAGEDKRYWENPGVDLVGIMRAVLYRVIGKTSKLEGTSTLTQQLVRNTVIGSEREIERKIKEIYLSYKLSADLSKEKILELYLNKIAFGHNSYGIEQASKTFFGKSAKDLSIMESSVLASLPKGPTYYSPYNHPDRLLGYPYVYSNDTATGALTPDDNKVDDITEILHSKEKEENKDMLELFSTFITGLKARRIEGTNNILICNLERKNFKTHLQIDNDNCSVMNYSNLLSFLNAIRIEKDGQFLEYQTGRKDFILGRMLEDNYITFEDYKKAILESVAYTFQKETEAIKAPHFVFYVKEYLEKKYGKDIVESGGLKIYTTLDSKLQAKAEELTLKYSQINEKKFGATNAAMISIDNTSGNILAMVGGRDYFDKDNFGNVNIITSPLQPGSTFKPFVYSLAMAKNELGTKSPIYDVETEFSDKYTPSNFDGTFLGKIDLSTALNSSRNIPAIKMFYLAGGEKPIVEFMQKLGVASLNTNGRYGAPLAIGTGEMTPLELASAYSVFANMGMKKEISPILKIIDSKGNVIEENRQKNEQVMTESQAYLINNILTDTDSRPSTWNPFLTISGRKIAAKTGTSTKQYIRDGKKIKLPCNLWTVGYTPQITTVAWAGNNNGKEVGLKGDGIGGASPIMKDFMEFAHKGKPVENWKQPEAIQELHVSEVSGLLPNPEDITNFLVNSLFMTPPTQYDNSLKKVKVDILCQGKITQSTPLAAQKDAYLVTFHSESPDNPRWETPVQIWANAQKPSSVEAVSSYYVTREKYNNIPNLITSINANGCDRKNTTADIIVKSTLVDNSILNPGINTLEVAYRGTSNITKLQILINDEVSSEIPLKNKREGAYIGVFTIPETFEHQKIDLKIRAIDEEYFSNYEEKTIMVGQDISSANTGTLNNTLPTEGVNITLLNPSNGNLKLYSDSFFNLRAHITENSNIVSTNILIDSVLFKGNIIQKDIAIGINEDKNLSVGKHFIEIQGIDINGKMIESKSVNLEILLR